MRRTILTIALGIGLMLAAPGETSAQCGPCDGTEAGGSYYHWFEFSQNEHRSCLDHGGCHPTTSTGACSKHDSCLNEEQEQQLAIALDAANTGELSPASLDGLLQVLRDRLALDPELGLVMALGCDGRAIAQISVPTEWLATS